MTNPPEEVTVLRSTVQQVAKTVYESRADHSPRTRAALTAVAAIRLQQGARARMWLLPADVAWLLAYAVDAADVHDVEPEDAAHPAVVAQAELRNAVGQAAPSTCRDLSLQRSLGEI